MGTMRYIKEMHHIKAELEIERLLDQAVDEMLREEFSLLEGSGRTGNDYNFDNGAKWSETLVGKLFSNIWRLVTLNGLLTSKFKDAVGVKSNLLKRLANKLEQAIAKLPAEYLDHTTAIDTDTRRIAFYSDVKKFFEEMSKPDLKQDVALKIIGDLIVSCESVMSGLDLTKKEPMDLEAEVKPVLNEAKRLEKRVSKLDPTKTVDYNRLAQGVANKNDIISKYNALSAKLKTILVDAAKDKKVGEFTETVTQGSVRSTYKHKGTTGGDDYSGSGSRVSGATRSMYDIIAIINKAHDLYVTHNVEDGKEYDQRDPRLFKLWESMVMKIMSKKGDLIPLTIKKYINSSLHEGFKKYEVKGEYGTQNILDELNNINSIINKVEKGDRVTQKPDIEAFNSDKSSSATFGYKAATGVIVIRNTQFENSPIILKVQKGEFFQNGAKLLDLKDNLITILPTQMTSQKVFTGVLSWTDDIFNSIKTSSGFTFDTDKMDLESLGSVVYDDRATLKIAEYYYAVFSTRLFSKGTQMEILCYSPIDDMQKALNENKPAARFVITLSEVYTTMGLDNNIVYLDPPEVRKIFGLGNQNFKKLDLYYKTNNKF